jgi:colanic acid/amylovoran biosynthesis glycosyltransferase
MRILVFSEDFGNSTKTFIYNEVVALAQHAEVWVLCNERGTMEPVRFPNVFLVPWNSSRIVEKIQWRLWQRDLLYTRWNPSFRKELERIIKEIKPDVIHGHFGIETIKITDNLITDEIPVVVTFHGYDATKFGHSKSYQRKLQQTFRRKNIYPVFVSEHIKRAVKKMGVDVEKGFVRYLGIDLSRFKRQTYPSREAGVKFVQISSFAPQKGHYVTVAAIRKFVDANPGVPVSFIFGGEGYEALELVRAEVQRLGLNDYVTFTGKLTPDQVRQHLEDAHIFMHHSITGPNGETEGLPTAIMEAMAMELPILSSWHAGIPELVQDGKNGLLVAENDSTTVALKMAEMLNWNYLPENRSRVMEMCEVGHHAVEMIELYSDIISRK